MNSYEILKNIHKVGHHISGVVLGYKKFEYQDLPLIYRVYVETNYEYNAVVDYNSYDYGFPLTEHSIPQKGTIIEMVVKNFGDDTLYCSAKPYDLEETEIKLYEDFYKIIETIKEGTVIEGKIRKVVPFGLFVEILDCPFVGLIDIGHFDFNGGKKTAYQLFKLVKGR